MTDNPSPPPREWWTRPGVVLPIVATIAIAVALLTPQASSGRFGDPRLSTHLAGSLGARIVSDLSKRLGWTVQSRDSVAVPAAGGGRTVHALLAPSRPVTREEAHAYLEAVRGGDALLYVLDARTPLSDSLGVRHYSRGGVLPQPTASARECGTSTDFTPPLWPDGRVHLWGIRWLRGVPDGRIVFATLKQEDEGPTIIGNAVEGFPYGRGRIVVVGDPDLLRNDVLRHCAWGADVIVVRALEWLRAGGPEPRTTLAFDEYHHGYGPRDGALELIVSFLLTHPVGRAIAVLALAALVMLLAKAPRALPPAHVERVERRDPLEQVDALAHAYEQVHATRTVTARLLRGLRWRVEHSRPAAWSRSDEQFLASLVDRFPAHATDIALVQQALDRSIPDRELPEVGEALQRIEHTLTTT